MTTLQIIPLTDEAELHCKYSRNCNPQPCELWLDARDGRASCSYRAEANSRSFAEYHGHIRTWEIPILTATAANELMQEVAELLQAVIDGYESVWDGNNTVARYTEAAQDAASEIDDICDDLFHQDHLLASVWEAYEWYDGNNEALVEAGLTAETPDDAIDGIVEHLQADALADGADRIDGLRDYVVECRDDMREQEVA